MLAHHVRLAVPRACRSGSYAPSLTRRTTRCTSAPAAAASSPVSCLAASRAVAAAAATAPYTHDAQAGAQRRRHFSSTSATRRREGPIDPAACVPPPPLSQAAAAAKAGPSQTQDHHDQHQQQQQQQEQQQQSRRRTRRRILFGAAYLLLGSTLGSVVRAALAPPDLPAPGTEQDAYLVAAIAEKARKLPLYQRLASDPAWTGWDAYEEFQTRTPPPPPPPSSSSSSSAAATSASSDTAAATTTTTKQPRAGPSLTASTLSGARGLAYQHIFHNAATHELVSIVYLGSSIAGWPGVVHGGAIATVLDETLGRCAVRLFPARTGVTANLEMDYKAPTRTEGFYVVRVRPAALEEEDKGKKNKKEGAKGDRKRWVMGELERLDGTVCVRAKALFVVPKGVKLAPISDRY